MPSSSVAGVFASACRGPVGFASESSSTIPDSPTGSRSGNWATRDRWPPMASMVFLSVDSKRSLRCSRRDTLSSVIPSFLAIRICVSLRTCRNSHKAISSAISSAARLNFLTLERGQLLDLVIDVCGHAYPLLFFSRARCASNRHQPGGSARDRTTFR